jgi:hypothetical protein
MRELLKYEKFTSINESKKYSSLDSVNKTWSGEYILDVSDYQKNGNKPLKGFLLVGKDSGKAVALTYLKSDGSEAKYFWIPNFGAYINKNIKGGISSIKITPRKNWINQPGNEEKLEEFLDGFEDSIEKEKTEKEKNVSLQAQKDLDLILDMYEINSPIEKFEKTDSPNEWKAILENGFNILIKKRSSEDLVGEFRIYVDSSSEVPSIEINAESNNQRFTFRRSKMDPVRRNISITSLKKDPVAHYLFKNIIGDLKHENEKSLLEYFESIVKGEDPNYHMSDDDKSYKRGLENRKEIDLVYKLLEDFLTTKKIEEIYNKNKKI